MLDAFGTVAPQDCMAGFPDHPQRGFETVPCMIAGRSHGMAGAIERTVTEPLYLDLHFDDGARFAQGLPGDRNALAFV